MPSIAQRKKFRLSRFRNQERMQRACLSLPAVSIEGSSHQPPAFTNHVPRPVHPQGSYNLQLQEPHQVRDFSRS